MATELNNMHENNSSLPNGSNKEQVLPGIDDRTKTARHPRWTRQETLVLIQGKKVVQSQIREGHGGTSAFKFDKNEPKWDSVSSYCKQHGVNRGPVQCRKRWSNILRDFKKIKTWASQIKEGVESFWMMKNDLKKEMKLPGFFNKEVYDVLDGGVFEMPAIPLRLVTTIIDAKNGEGYEGSQAQKARILLFSDRVKEIMAEEEKQDEEEEAEAVLDSNRHIPAKDGLFSNFEPSGHKGIDQSPEKETTERENPTKTVATLFHISDTAKEKYPSSSPRTGSTSQERRKRRRLSFHVTEDNIGDRLLKVLERNSSMLNAQLDAQNINCQLEKGQRKEHSDGLSAAVNKLTDALLRIADKL